MDEKLSIGESYFVQNLPVALKQKKNRGLFYLLKKGDEENLSSLPGNMSLEELSECNQDIPKDSLYLFSYRKSISIEYKPTFQLDLEIKSNLNF
jgi:hypothetical protein